VQRLRALAGFVAGALLIPDVQAGSIEGVNHTHWAINRFSVEGVSGIDIIGPYQRGGGGCCYVAPLKWEPGMVVRVDWETGASGVSELADEFPGFADEAKYDAWLDKVEQQRRRHSKVVAVPDYTGLEVCGLTVHFLPCEDVQATTSCHAFGSPAYPIKTPLKLLEQRTCPK